MGPLAAFSNLAGRALNVTVPLSLISWWEEEKDREGEGGGEGEGEGERKVSEWENAICVNQLGGGGGESQEYGEKKKEEIKNESN